MLWSINETSSQSEQVNKCEPVTTLQIAQQLKTKNINVVSWQLFWRQCQAKFKLKFNLLLTDTGNEFTKCQTPRKMVPINSHLSCQLTRIYENF